MTTQQTEVLQDFAEIIEDLENAKTKAFEKGENGIGEKISGVIEAFKEFTEEGIIRLDEIMNL